MAKRANDMVMRKLRRSNQRCRTDAIPIYGGDIESFDAFLISALQNRPQNISSETMEALVHHYGSNYHNILAYADENPEWLNTVGDSNVLIAQVIHAIREEMALKLSDVIFRRTDLGTAEYPGDHTLEDCAEYMAVELGWSPEEKQKEIEEVQTQFHNCV